MQDYERGRQDERAEIVAALRRMVIGGRMWTEAQAIAADVLLGAADEIEAGLHPVAGPPAQLRR